MLSTEEVYVCEVKLSKDCDGGPYTFEKMGNIRKEKICRVCRNLRNYKKTRSDCPDCKTNFENVDLFYRKRIGRKLCISCMALWLQENHHSIPTFTRYSMRDFIKSKEVQEGMKNKKHRSFCNFDDNYACCCP